MSAPNITTGELAYYEGLVRKTASRYVGVLASRAMDFEDICQILRLAAWRALESFDAEKASNELEDWVFQCVRNQAKDLVKRRRQEIESPALMIEDVAPTVNGNGAVRDAFELHYMSATEEVAFMSVLEPPPMVPSTLSHNERRVLRLLYNDYRQVEIAPMLRLSPGEVKAAVKAIREKMADWAPLAVAA